MSQSPSLRVDVSDQGVCIADLTKIELQLKVTATYAESNDIEYKLTLFSDAHSCLNTPPITIGQLSAPITVPYCLPVQDSSNEVQCWLYRTGQVEFGLTAQQLVGTCTITLKTRSIGKLLDVMGHVQGIIEVNIPQEQLRGITLNKKQTTKQHRDLFQSLMQQSKQVYSSLDYDHLQYFVYINTAVDVIPLLSFPVLSTRIRAEPSAAEALLLRLYRIATEVHFVSGFEVVADMCTLLLRAMVYMPDRVRGTDGIIDQWVRLGCFPDLGLACYDCEDGSELILELLHILKHTQFSNASLKRLQQQLRNYTTFFAVGKLQTSSGVIPHAFVMLLDREYVDKVLYKNKKKNTRTVFHSAMIIESTNYTESLWSTVDTSNEEQEQAYEKEQQFIKSLGSKDEREKYSTILKSKMPVRITKTQCLYTSVTALMTADHIPGQATHFLLKHGEKVGVQVDSLMEYQCGPDSVVALQLDDTSELLNALRELPLAKWPTAATTPLQLPKGKGKKKRPSLDMRTIDYTQLKKELSRKGNMIQEMVTNSITESASLTTLFLS